MWFAAIFVIGMVGIILLLALIQKLFGWKIFDDTPTEDDWFHW